MQLKEKEDMEERRRRQIQNNASRELTGQSLNANTRNMKGPAKLVINVAYTQYELLETVAQENNFLLSHDEEGEEEWDIWWIDSQIFPTLISKMKWFQRTNHLPAVHNIAKKSSLAQNLNQMQKAIPEEYDFFPTTWLIPKEAKAFKEQFNANRAKTFIVKPLFNCQGIGIFLTRNFDWVKPNEHYVAQKYIHKPYLIDGLKFDLRLYVLVTGISPLRCFIYKEGLARFATVKYQGPKGSNLKNLYMHLTNYAINKENPEYQQNQDKAMDDTGHKRSIDAIFNHIDEEFAAEQQPGEPKHSDKIWQQIKEVCAKTLMSSIHPIDHMMRSTKPQDTENSLCF